MAKNYYWNQGCTFPITKKDVIDGRAYMFLEAIRKLIFLIENPQAGYYREDYPSAVHNGTAWIDNSDVGSLPVYYETGGVGYVVSGDGAGGVNNRTFANWRLESPQTVTNENVNPANVSHERGEFRLWCDGVIYQDTISSQNIELAPSESKTWVYIAPPTGGWFADNSSGGMNTIGGWVKTASKNNYYQWDANAFREIHGGLVRAYLGQEPIIENWRWQAWQQYPKQFDPYEVQRPIFRVPDAFLDNGKLLIYGEDELVLNKYYALNRTSLWKCLNASTEDAPSATSEDWERVNLLGYYDEKDYRFLASEIEIKKHQFYKEDIQGALYSAQNQISEQPYMARTQYRQNYGLPPAAIGASTYPDDLKITETIMAYVERIFDGSRFYAEVDSDYKANYHAAVGGEYNDDPYDSYDDAINGGKADLIRPINEPYWGCNQSGFEWVLKKLGDFNWYYDTENPYFWDVSTWDFSDINPEAARNELTAKLSDFISNIQGSWRRTWKYAIGKPKEINRFRSGSEAAQKAGAPLAGYALYTTDPVEAISQWHSKLMMNAGTYSFTEFYTDSYTHSADDVPTANDTEVSGSYEPTQSYEYNGETVREWEIDKLVDVINHIWDVLNVAVGYADDASIQTAAGSAVISLEMMRMDEAKADLAAQIANYLNASYGSGTSSNNAILTYSSEDAYGFRLIDVGISLMRVTVTIQHDYTGNPNGATYQIPIRFWSPLHKDITSYMPAGTSTPGGYNFPNEVNGEPVLDWLNDNFRAENVLPCALSQLSGDFNLGAAVSPRDTADDPIVVIHRLLKFVPETMTQSGSNSVARAYFIATPAGINGVDTKTPVTINGETWQVYLQSDGADYRYSSTRQINHAIIQNQVLVVFDWNRVPSRVFWRDGNYPILVESFELPILPPYPNPPYWMTAPTFIEADEGLNEYAIQGLISNCTSVPSGRTVRYHFRLKTADFNLSATDAAVYDPDSTYSTDDEVQFNGYIYTALRSVPMNQYPYDDGYYWSKGDAVSGWSSILKDSSNYEYVDNNYIQLQDLPQDDTFYELMLIKNIATIQNYLWYWNLAAWSVFAKADDGIETYDNGKETLWSEKELVIGEDSSLDLGFSYTAVLDGNTGVWTVTVINGWGGEQSVLENLHPEVNWANVVSELIGWELSDGTTGYSSFSMSEAEFSEAVAQGLKLRMRLEFVDAGDEPLYTFISGWVNILPLGGLNW